MKKTSLQKMDCRGSGMNQSRIVAIMAAVIVVLAVALVYSLALKPAFNGYVVAKQVEAQESVVSAIVGQVGQTGYVQIPVGEGEQPIILVTPESCYEILGVEKPQQQEVAQ